MSTTPALKEVLQALLDFRQAGTDDGAVELNTLLLDVLSSVVNQLVVPGFSLTPAVKAEAADMLRGFITTTPTKFCKRVAASSFFSFALVQQPFPDDLKPVLKAYVEIYFAYRGRLENTDPPYPLVSESSEPAEEAIAAEFATKFSDTGTNSPFALLDFAIQAMNLAAAHPANLNMLLGMSLLANVVAIMANPDVHVSERGGDFFWRLHGGGRYSGHEVYPAYIPAVLTAIQTHKYAARFALMSVRALIQPTYKGEEGENLADSVVGWQAPAMLVQLVKDAQNHYDDSDETRNTIDVVCSMLAWIARNGVVRAGPGEPNLHKYAFEDQNAQENMLGLFEKVPKKSLAAKGLAQALCGIMKGEKPDPPEQYGPVLKVAQMYINQPDSPEDWNGKEAFEGVLEAKAVIAAWEASGGKLE